MKTVHWTTINNSGLSRVSESMVTAEKTLGIDSHLRTTDGNGPSELEDTLDADVHVFHTKFPDWLVQRAKKPLKLVWVGHGTPEHVFKESVIDGSKKTYGHSDGVMLLMHWLRIADARVTFWPWHQAIYQSLCDKGTKVHCIPMGVDQKFWKPVESAGKYLGSPSVFTAENPHDIKWPLDLFLAWPWIYPKLTGDAYLHAVYVPNDMHRWWFPIVNRNSCAYKAHISPLLLTNEQLRNAYCSVDYYIGLVRYGDHNRVCLEASACGCKVISYRGNPYADFWITEGDQRAMAEELIEILSGKVKPREKEPVADVLDTSKAMIKIYEEILK